MTFTYEHRVRFRECDPMGVVYHTHYIDYFEAARTEWLRAAGLPYKTLQDQGTILPVIEVNVRYARPARYDDLLTIEVSCADEIPGPRIRIDYNVFRADTPKALVTGHVTLCFVDERSGRPVAAPPIFQEALARLASSDPLG